MRLSFDDPESFKEIVGSRRFIDNNPPSDLNTSSMQQLGPRPGQEIGEDTSRYDYDDTVF